MGKEAFNNQFLNKKDNNYDNKEEKRVITGTEQRTARANGEISANSITRNNHDGLPVITNSPTSNKVNPAKTVQFNKRLESNAMFSNKVSWRKYEKK